MIKLINLNKQYLLCKTSIKKNINKVLENNNFIMGPEIKTLEKQLCKITKSKYCATVSSGTDALLIALMSINIRKGDEVIVPAFTYISPIEAIVRLGATPVFVDVHLDSGNINTKLIEKKISKKTKAIIFVNLYGNLCNISDLKTLKKKFNKIIFIEDAAQSFGAKYKDFISCNTLDISCTSFFPTKNLGCYGDGGAIFTNNKKNIKKVKMIREHGQIKKYHHNIIGIGGRLDTIQGSILLSKLKYFNKERILRRKNFLYFDKILTKIIDQNKNKIGKFKFSKYSKPNYASFNILVQPLIRKKLINYLIKHKISSTIYYPKIATDHMPYKKFMSKTNLINSRYISKRILSLPFGPYIKKTEINNIGNIISNFYNL
jgi:UDP-2-acetamido-2-deoxy-ribo-hexuluronate aminotransferase